MPVKNPCRDLTTLNNKKMKKKFSLTLLLVSSLLATPIIAPLTKQSDPLFNDPQVAIKDAKTQIPLINQAKNVIIFIGEAMNFEAITAARIYADQLNKKKGNENLLAIERFPHVALSKTDNNKMQTQDSAATATNIFSGIKTKSGVLNINDNARRGECSSVAGNKVDSMFTLAAEKGKALGIVSTARITHATPAAAYAHTPDRNWENNGSLPVDAKEKGCKDIASQFISFSAGDGFKVALGGGRREFLPTSVKDPEYSRRSGKRTDNRNLINEWQRRYPNGQFVYNLYDFKRIDANKNTRLFGLFEPSHMKYESDRKITDREPSLAQMTEKAIDILDHDQEGYLLMVESGRIDHAQYNNNTARALEDTLAFDQAIAVALEKTNPKDTLIIVTADHGHSMIMNNAKRSNPILNISRQKEKFKEEIFIFAYGPQACLFQGAVEQNYIFQVIDKAMNLTSSSTLISSSSSTSTPTSVNKKIP